MSSEPEAQPLAGPPPPASPSQAGNIESLDASLLTTPGISEFRKLLDKAHRLHSEISQELSASQSAERAAGERYLSWKNGWLLRRLMKGRFAQLEAEARDTEARRRELQEQETLSRLETKIEIPPRLEEAFFRFCDAFRRLAGASRIWDTVSHEAIDQARERTQASRRVERRLVRFRIGNCAVIQSDWEVPHLGNANGGDLFLFPLFVVYFKDRTNFALLEYREIRINCGISRFHEEEAVPPDSKVVGTTWAKTNKDGSRDRRFKENYEIPIAQYGKIVFQSATGLHEEYMVSNVEACQTFEKEWQALVKGISAGV